MSRYNVSNCAGRIVEMQRLDGHDFGRCDVLCVDPVRANVRFGFVLQGKNNVERLGQIDFVPNVFILGGDLHIRD